MARQTPRGWWPMLVLALLIFLYGMAYVVLGERMYSPDLAPSFRARPWGIYPHAFFASIALIIGPFQFHRGLLRKRRSLHRMLGKSYLLSAMIGPGAAGGYMSLYSFGGLTTHIGFGVLAAFVALTTLLAFIRVRNGDIASHREWMIRSYALIFAAVTLRLWLPLLITILSGDFVKSYQIVSWLSWVPNLAVAEWYIRTRKSGVILRDLMTA